MMDVEPIAHMLKNSIGLDMASVSKSFIEAAIKSRIAKTQTSSVDHYLQRLQDFPMELAELIEETVIPETWFFRDAEAIWSMVRNAQALLFKDDKAVVRILSLPCASGEEPYSLAMALADAGISAQRFQIDAIDVSQRALEQARRAVYGNNAFRGVACNRFGSAISTALRKAGNCTTASVSSSAFAKGICWRPALRLKKALMTWSSAATS
jgi:chemotaxis protein methyltransferase WspC